MSTPITHLGELNACDSAVAGMRERVAELENEVAMVKNHERNLLQTIDELRPQLGEAQRRATASESEVAGLRAEVRGWNRTMEDLHSQIDESFPDLKPLSGAIQDKIIAIAALRTAHTQTKGTP